MPLVNPVCAVYALIAQEPNDLLLHAGAGGEGLAGGERLQHVRVHGWRWLALQGEGVEILDAFERPQRPGHRRLTVALEHGERHGRVVGVRTQSRPGAPHSVVGEGGRQVADVPVRVGNDDPGTSQVVEHPGPLEHLKWRHVGDAALGVDHAIQVGPGGWGGAPPLQEVRGRGRRVPE